MKQFILILVLIIVVVWILYQRSIEYFEVPDDPRNIYNPMNNALNAITKSNNINDIMQEATKSVSTTHQDYIATAFEHPNSDNQMVRVGVSPDKTDNLRIAQTVCEVRKGDKCSIFKEDATFAKYCGINLDSTGTNSEGKKHVGGLYIDPDNKNSKPLDGIYSPDIGSSGIFAIDEESCEYLKEDMKCKMSGVVESGNCTKCSSDGKMHALRPKVGTLNPTFVFYTNATDLRFTIEDTNTNFDLLTRNPKTVTIHPNAKKGATITDDDGTELTQVTLSSVPIKEGQTFYIMANSTQQVVLGGYVEAPTQKGPYTMDMTVFLIPYMNGEPPIIGGGIDIGNNKYILLVNQPYQTPALHLKGYMPYTFVGTDTNDSFNCRNGPFLTKVKSVTFIDKNAPCYSSDAAPGNYSKECLIQIFKASGGLPAGSGHPSKPGATDILLKNDDGSPRKLSDIAEFLYKINVLAATGLVDGKSVPMSQWNNASLYLTGKDIGSPCDTSRPGQPLSNACLSKLYLESKCSTMGTYNPDPTLKRPIPQKIAEAKAKGDKTAAGKFYTDARANARNSNKSNFEREDDFMGCYGIQLRQLTKKLALYVSVDRPEVLNISQLVVKDENGVNVAKGGDTSKTTGGTSSYPNAPPSRAVDGVEAARPHPQIYHSNFVGNPWFTVKLTKPSIITQIVYYGRSSCCAERNEVYIKIWNEDGQGMWQSPKLTRAEVQTLNIPASIFK